MTDREEGERQRDRDLDRQEGKRQRDRDRDREEGESQRERGVFLRLCGSV